MTALLLIPFYILIGIALKKLPPWRIISPKFLVSLVFSLFLPAATLVSLHGQTFSIDYILPVLVVWLSFILSCLIFGVLLRRIKWNSKLRGAMILTAGLGNTSFIGFPVLLALYGPASMRLAILSDQPGSFLVVSTFGILIISIFSVDPGAEKPSLRKITGLVLERVLKFPPFYGLVIAYVTRNLEFPAPLMQSLKYLAAPLIPVSLIAVGLYLKLNLTTLRTYKWPVTLALGFRLLISPALALAVACFVFHAQGLLLQVPVMEAGMPPMTTAALLAIQMGLDAEFAALMLTMGIPLSAVTLSAWSHLL